MAISTKQTICRRFVNTVEAHGDRVALRAFVGDDPEAPMTTMTWADYGDQVACAAAGLQVLGLQPGDRVVLAMRNIPDFHVIDLAVSFCGATPVSIYPTVSPEQLAHVAGDSAAKLAVVEDAELLERFLAVRDELDELRGLLLLDNPLGLRSPGVLNGPEVLQAYRAIDIYDALDDLASDDPATIVYPFDPSQSDPVGDAVTLSHDDVLSAADRAIERLDVEPLGMRTISYLPMAHTAARLADHYLAICGALDVTTCPDPALLPDYLRAARPRAMLGVPRVWESLRRQIEAEAATDEEARASFEEAIAAGAPLAERRRTDKATTDDHMAWEELDESTFRQVRKQAGLTALRVAFGWSRPIPSDLLGWYRTIGVSLTELELSDDTLADDTPPATATDLDEYLDEVELEAEPLEG